MLVHASRTDRRLEEDWPPVVDRSMGEKRECSRTTSTGRRVSTGCQGWISGGGCPAQRQESLSSKDRGGDAELQCGREAWRWGFGGVGIWRGAGAAAEKKSRRAWFSTWMRAAPRQRSELSLRRFSVSPALKSSRDAEWRAQPGRTGTERGKGVKCLWRSKMRGRNNR